MAICSLIEVQAFFRASTYTILGNGSKALFWTDRWVQGKAIQDMAPTLISLVSLRHISSETVASALATGSDRLAAGSRYRQSRSISTSGTMCVTCSLLITTTVSFGAGQQTAHTPRARHTRPSPLDIAPNTGLRKNLGNMSSSKSQALSMASDSAAPLDSRQAPTP